MKVFSLTMVLVFVFGGAAAGKAPTEDMIPTDDGPAMIYPIEHATFVIVWAGKTIIVDPVGGADRFSEYGTPDLLLITDIDRDHFSLSTIAGLLVEKTAVVASADVVQRFPEPQRRRIWTLANGQSREWDDSLIEAVPMYNLDPERAEFHPKGRGNGYVLTLGSTRIYISGDTEDTPEMRALEDIDAAFVCMNLPYTMDVKAAASAVLEFQPKVVYPYHYRGSDGMSDLRKFRKMVGKNKAIEVRLLEWYP
jgi:L-ascorbate metabolism protein UlaG (beta-lactamase superfamily)